MQNIGKGVSNDSWRKNQTNLSWRIYTQTTSKIGFCRRRTAPEFESRLHPFERDVREDPGASLNFLSLAGKAWLKFRAPCGPVRVVQLLLTAKVHWTFSLYRNLGIFPTFEVICV